MKEKIIIIEGASYLRSDIKLVQKLIVLFYKIFNVVPFYDKEHEKWLKLIENGNREMIYFDWSGQVWPHVVNKAARKLALLVEKEGPVKIISTSLGTQIAIKASKHTQNIKKIVSLSGVYTPRPISIEFIDIYSTSDRFANVFRCLLKFIAIHRRIKRREVILHNIRHDQFRDDLRFTEGEFKGFTMSELLNHFL
ncbi:MAG: hypothetical protein WAV15_04020 [Minisyncoccia bacterium]